MAYISKLSGSFYHLRPLLIFFILISQIFLAHCASNPADRKTKEGNFVPPYLFSKLSGGIWSADLQVLNSEGLLQHEEAMSVNQETGEALSSKLKLPKGYDYKVQVIFNYEKTGVKLPVAFMGLIHRITLDFEDYRWEDEDVALNPYQALPDTISSYLAGTPLFEVVNLDADSDGVPNFYEFLAGSDPQDATNLPSGPRLTQNNTTALSQDVINISLSFEDNLGINKLEPIDPVCGYYDWVITGDKSEVKTITAKFNTYAFPADFPKEYGDGPYSLNLGFKATNGFGISEVHFIKVEFTQSGNPGNNGNPGQWGPEIYIKNPEPNQALSDSIHAEVIACDRDGIKSLEPKLIKKETWEDNNKAGAVFTGTILASVLGEGLVPLTFEATALDQGDPTRNANLSKSKTIYLNITSANVIQVSPAEGSILRDRVEIKGEVNRDLFPEVKTIEVETIETSGEFGFGTLNKLYNDLELGLPDVFKGILDNTAFILDQQEIKVTFLAKGDNQQAVRRTYKFLVKNSPNIESFKIKNSPAGTAPCLIPGSAEVEWVITNWGNTYGSHLHDGEALIQVLENDTWVDELIDDEWQDQGGRKITCAAFPKNNFSLRAKRIGLDSSGAVGKEFSKEQTINYTPVFINDFVSGQVVHPDKGIEINLKGIDPGLAWRVLIKKPEIPLIQAEFVGTLSNHQIQISPEQIKTKLASQELYPRQAYEAILQIVSDIGGEELDIITESDPIPFLLSDIGLAGWWRLKRRSLAS